MRRTTCSTARSTPTPATRESHASTMPTLRAARRRRSSGARMPKAAGAWLMPGTHTPKAQTAAQWEWPRMQRATRLSLTGTGRTSRDTRTSSRRTIATLKVTSARRTATSHMSAEPSAQLMARTHTRLATAAPPPVDALERSEAGAKPKATCRWHSGTRQSR